MISTPETAQIQTLEAENAQLKRDNELLQARHHELASIRNKFVDLYDFAPLGYLILTPTAEIVEANMFAAQLVGLTRSQLLGKRLTSFIHLEDQAQFEAFLMQTINELAPCHSEVRINPSTGTTLDISLHARLVQEAGGDGQIYLTISDITSSNQIKAERIQLLAEKNEAVRKLERALAMLDSLFEEAPVGLAFLDEDLRFQKLNRALAEINGISMENHLGKTPSELLPDLPPEATTTHLETVIIPFPRWVAKFPHTTRPERNRSDSHR